MNHQVLELRISQCVDDLGLLLDQIYKFSQRQREGYFDRIQSMKNKLLILKSNIRDFNTLTTQKQYKQLYISTNSLKNQIQHQLALIPSVKQNKEVNRFKDVRDVRKNYEETMKLIVIKDEEIKHLKNLLFQKQQMVQINCQELKNIKEESELIIENNRIANYEYSNYKIQLERTKGFLSGAESEIVDLKMREEEKDIAFNGAIEELENLKIELLTANERIINLDRLVSINMAKTISSEDTFRKTEKTTQNTDILKEHDSFRKLREVSELQFELGVKNGSIKEFQQQNKHLKEDIEVMESQNNKLQTKINELKLQSSRQKQSWLFEQKRIEKDLQIADIRQSELKKLLEDSEKKYHTVLNKLNTAEDYKGKLKETDFQNELLNQKIYNLEVYIDKLQNDIKNLSKEREKVLIKQQRDGGALRELEVQLFKMNERTKIKDEDIIGLSHELQLYKNKIREYEKQLTLREKKEKSIENNLIEQKTRLIKMQEKDKVRNRQIQGLKVKLFRAKIETIHEIRQTMN